MPSRPMLPTVPLALGLVLFFMGISNLLNNREGPLDPGLVITGALSLLASTVGFQLQANRVEQRAEARRREMQRLSASGRTMAASAFEVQETVQVWNERMRIEGGIVLFSFAAIPLLGLLFTPASSLGILGELGEFKKNAIALLALFSLAAACLGFALPHAEAISFGRALQSPANRDSNQEARRE